jgi:glyoxylase-like metal-dependent hydrolase (beta-lactamase superfamily II)
MTTIKGKMWSVLGNTQALDGGAMFGNVPKAMWSSWVDVDANNLISLNCRALLVREHTGRTLLFETGIGAFFPPRLKQRYGVVEEDHRLLANLAQLGLSDAEIDVVVLSHLHFDHAGGLLAQWETDKPPRLLFPNARFVVGARAWERACHPHPRDRASFISELPELLEATGRLDLIDQPHSATLGPGYICHFFDGHTPGLLLAEIASNDGPITFASDLIPGQAWVHLPITMGYDRYPELLIEEKEKLLSDLLQRHGRLFFTHDTRVALASISQDERGRYGCSQTWANLDGLDF